MTTAVRCAIRAALRAACAAQFSLRTCNTHARAPPPAEEPEYEIEEILKKRKRKNKEYDPEGEGEDAEPEYVEEYYVKWKGWDGPKDNTWEPLAHVEDTVQYEKYIEAYPWPEPKKPKKQKTEEDPDAPPKVKKNMSAYMHFMNGERERIKEENPAATFGELGKIAGAEWKSLADDDEKKLKYTKAAEEDKARYDAEKPPEPPKEPKPPKEKKVKSPKPTPTPTPTTSAESQEGGDDAGPPSGAPSSGGKAKKEKKEKDPDAPKRPPSAYLMFMSDVRPTIVAENEGIKQGDIAKLGATKWKELGDEAKEKYNEQYRVAKGKWEAAKAAYDQEKKAAAAGAATSAAPAPPAASAPRRRPRPPPPAQAAPRRWPSASARAGAPPAPSPSPCRRRREPAPVAEPSRRRWPRSRRRPSGRSNTRRGSGTHPPRRGCGGRRWRPPSERPIFCTLRLLRRRRKLHRIFRPLTRSQSSHSHGQCGTSTPCACSSSWRAPSCSRGSSRQTCGRPCPRTPRSPCTLCQ